MNSLIVIFYKPFPRINNHYETQVKLWIKFAQKWAEHIDEALIYCVGMDEPENIPFKNYKIEKREIGSHWGLMREAVQSIQGDKILLIDPDMLVYDKQIVEDGYSGLDSHDIVSILDNSGSKDLFPANEFRDIRRRICPYLCFINKKVLFETDLNFDPKDGHDSMGWITEQLKDKKIWELPDDRTTLRLNEDGTYSKDTWLDGQGFKWSTPLDTPRKYGYYHIRNSTAGVRMMNCYKEGNTDELKITPRQEALRIMAWQWICDKFTGELDKWINDYNPLLKEYNVSMSDWIKYIGHFEDYHKWITQR